MKEIAVDVLVVGGGVQGLMVLRDLSRLGYSVLLLETSKLGGGQTCHSHVLIHQGHLCRKPSLASEFKEGFELWRGLLATRFGGGNEIDVVIGFDDEVDAIEQQSIWGAVNPPIQCARRPAPPEFGVSRLKRTFGTSVIALTSDQIVETLVEGLTAITAKIDRPEHFRVKGRSIEEVTVDFPTQPSARIKPGAVVLAAGAGNQALLDLLSERASGAQRNRKAPVLVVSGDGQMDLPRIGGFFVIRGNGISIAPREHDGRVVWLISDSRILINASGEQAFIGWFRSLLADLQQLAPALFGFPQKLRWALHMADKSEGGGAYRWPYSGRIEQFGIDNLWTVWPTFLTLAPLLSRRVCDGITLRLPRKGAARMSEEPFWQVPQRSAEYWQRHSHPDNLQAWESFSKHFGGDGDPEVGENDYVGGS